MIDYENAIEIKELSKSYDGFKLDNVSFSVPKGSIMGFIGQNGAGKTTTIRMLLGITKPDSGEIELLGRKMPDDEYGIKADISAVFDEIPFNDNFNAMQVEKVLSKLYKNWDSQTYSSYIDRFGLPRKKKI